MKQGDKRKGPANQVRIIGGSLRGRKINFVAVEGLRPTPDRVRETLFNWLAPVIPNSCCLDLFSGSGALGFEALSRGAQHVTFVDRDAQVVAQIKKQLALFNLANADVYQTTISNQTQLPTPAEPYNIIFIDPPFQRNLIPDTCAWLEQQSWLAEKAWFYLEAEVQAAPLLLPPSWELLRSKTAGQVGYHLYFRHRKPNA